MTAGVASARGAKGGSRVSGPRRCAYRVLRRVSEQGAYADRAFRAEAERAGLGPRDRAFAQRLVYGAVQRRATLDHVLGALADRSVEAIDPPLRDALRLGLLQLVYLDAVPDHAAVDQTVELAGLGRPAGRGFVNAVMRRAAREARQVVAGLSADSPAEAAVLHSHPEWLVRLWWGSLGPEETRLLLERDNEPPESAVRANELLTTRAELRASLRRAGVRSRPAPGVPEGLVLEAPFDVHGSPLFEAGALIPQSRASMLAGRVLGPRPGERVLDLCAAPGAKATHIAALMRGRGTLVAVERHAGRCAELASNLRRMGAPWAEVRRADAASDPSGELFDRVLLDPPCSDLGVLQARPDARWRKTPAQIEDLAATQSSLLAAAAARVRPGGVLVYSTCTISPRENQERVEELLAARPDLAADDLGAEHPQFRHPAAPRCLQLLPHRDRTDGFFVARLRRADG